MKTLTTVLESAVTPLYESLLDDFDDLEKASNSDIKASIIDFVKNNYKGIEKITLSDKINDDGKYVVDIKGYNIQLGQNIKKLTNDLFIFGTVEGDFKCAHCHSLISLEGAPQKIKGDFACYTCSKLKTLEGGPKEVGGNFVCDWCESLTSLKGGPKEVGKDFHCNYCDSLKSLEGAPQKVGCDFECVECSKLQSLKGAPKEVGGNFVCSYCPNLKSLEGAPSIVGQTFNCNGCHKLISLEGAPKQVHSFRCSSCKGKFQESDVRKYCKEVVKIICKGF